MIYSVHCSAGISSRNISYNLSATLAVVDNIVVSKVTQTNVIYCVQR